MSAIVIVGYGSSPVSGQSTRIDCVFSATMREAQLYCDKKNLKSRAYTYHAERVPEKSPYDHLPTPKEASDTDMEMAKCLAAQWNYDLRKL